MSNKYCPLDGNVEDQGHALGHCLVRSLMCDTICKAYGVLVVVGKVAEPSHILLGSPRPPGRCLPPIAPPSPPPNFRR